MKQLSLVAVLSNANLKFFFGLFGVLSSHKLLAILRSFVSLSRVGDETLLDDTVPPDDSQKLCSNKSFKSFIACILKVAHNYTIRALMEAANSEQKKSWIKSLETFPCTSQLQTKKLKLSLLYINAQPLTYNSYNVIQFHSIL